MMKQTPQTRTLAQALRISGSSENLAEQLGCDTAELDRWLAGDEPTPPGIYLKALDLVSLGTDHPTRARHK
jgi:hypothetical protein